MLNDADAARLACILAGLAPADRGFLEALVLPRWVRRRRRLAARDALIWDACERFFPDRHVTVAARRLAVAIGGYRASNWRWEQSTGVPAGASERHQAMHRILAANGGRTLGWRRIVDILDCLQ
jgi:hypothetical protein